MLLRGVRTFLGTTFAAIVALIHANEKVLAKMLFIVGHQTVPQRPE
jgi:hypothetical protein